MKKWWKNFSQSAKNAILTQFFSLEKKFQKKNFLEFLQDLNEFSLPVKKFFQNFINTDENELTQIS